MDGWENPNSSVISSCLYLPNWMNNTIDEARSGGGAECNTITITAVTIRRRRCRHSCHLEGIHSAGTLEPARHWDDGSMGSEDEIGLQRGCRPGGAVIPAPF